jgi:hypothetical protein
MMATMPAPVGSWFKLVHQRTRGRPGDAEVLEGLQAQKRLVKLLVREAKDAFYQKQATAVNSAFSGQADGHSPLGKKRFWRQLQAMYMYNPWYLPLWGGRRPNHDV